MRFPTRRIPIGIGALTLSAAAVLPATPSYAAATPAATSTPTTSVPAKAAAGWLAAQLVGSNKDHYTFAGTTYADDGNTADGVLAMDAAGVAQAAATRATAWLESDAVNYATGGGYTEHYYPGALAKLLLVAEAQHVDVHAFGSLDLPAALTNEEQPSGVFANTDDTSYGSSVLDQSLALIALSHTGSAADAPDAKAVSWLTGQQCGDGSFQYTVQTTPAATCLDLDTTAFAAQALTTVGSSAATAALGWLAAHKNPDGGYGLDPTGKASSNANSTAVAVQALLLGGHSATTGLNWLLAHQQGCAAPAAQRGSIGFQSPYDAKTALRATAQATQALARGTLGHIDNTGATAAAPVLACATKASGSGSGSSTSSKATGGSGTKSTSRSTSGTRGTSTAILPVTGAAPVGPSLLLAGALLGCGALLLGLSRRRLGADPS